MGSLPTPIASPATSAATSETPADVMSRIAILPVLAFVNLGASGYGIYLLDLDKRGNPIPVVTAADGEDDEILVYAAVSVSYLVLQR